MKEQEQNVFVLTRAAYVEAVCMLVTVLAIGFAGGYSLAYLTAKPQVISVPAKRVNREAPKEIARRAWDATRVLCGG